MIFRRVKAHIEKENWFAVGVDFAIVVIGVFIGIQVANWNDVRKDKALERDYVLRLLEDVERSRSEIEATNRWLARQVDDERVLLDALEACAVMPDQQGTVVRALGALGKFEFAILDRQLIDQLRASGEFNLIQSQSVRAAINNLTLASDNQLRVEDQFRAHATPWVNYARDFYYFDSEQGAQSERWETWDALRFNLTEACEDFRFEAAVGNTREATRNLHSWNSSILSSVKDAEAVLSAEITERGWSE